jgi:DNA-binding response OmpR family regulator
MTPKILVVDDEERLISVLEAYLSQEGFHVLTALNGRDGLAIARREDPDLIILDVMMPEVDGYDFIRQHRLGHETPIILLTARADDEDKVVGLELGADDYVTKPFRPRELMARIRAVMRRAGRSSPRPGVLQHADITLDLTAYTLRVGETLVDLTPSEFDLLAALMSAPGRAFTRLDLLDRVQGTRYEGYARTIDVHIKNLRAKIEPNPASPTLIQTVYGVGYRLAADA